MNSSDSVAHTKNFSCILVIYISHALILGFHVSFCLIIIEKILTSEDKYSFFSFVFISYLVCVPFLLFSKHKFVTSYPYKYIRKYKYKYILINIYKRIWENEEPFAFGLISFNRSYAAQFSAIFTVSLFDV